MNWRTEDVVDLEAFLIEDRGKTDAELRVRDGAIRAGFLPECLGAQSAGAAGAREKIRCWLERRRELAREEMPDGALPGEIFHQSEAALRWLAGALGCCIGGSLALSIFRWHGGQAIDASWFFAETVLVQLALLAGALLFLARHAAGGRGQFSIVQSLVAFAFAQLARLGGKTLAQMPGRQRARARAGLGALCAKRTIYGALATWPVLIITQIFALGFNAGLLVTILSWVRFSELSFVWSSTLDDPRQSTLVEAVSLPWRFAPNACPSPAQIERSRKTSARDAVPPDRDARRAWWPFLCYSVAVYGFLPRAILLAWAAWKQRQALARIPFDQADCQALLARLGGLAVQSGTPGPALEQTHPGRALATSARDFSAGECVAFAPPEITVTDAALAAAVGESLHWQVARMIRAEIDFLPACAEALDALASAATASRGVCAAVLVEDWQPPREAFFSFIHAVRERLGASQHIAVLLLVTASGSTAAAAENARAWRGKIAATGDPYLRVESARLP